MKGDWFLLSPDSNIERHRVLNLADIVECTEAEGPGRRFALWVQGCPIRCQGCWNRHMWPMRWKHPVDTKKLLQYIREFEDELDGVTILGGEPLAQAKPLVTLIEDIKSTTKLSVMLYTGYDEYEVVTEEAKRAVRLSDMVVFGPFVETLKAEGLRWMGSLNQYIRFNNPEYRRRYFDTNEAGSVEIIIDSDDMEITLVGYPDEELLENVIREQKRRYVDG